MPFYEYQCKNCGHALEAMQKINDAPLKKCPHCGKSQLQRLMSAPVFRLKGGGWYETDFKGDQDNKRNLADRPETDAAKEDKKAPSPGESKSEGAAKESGGKEAAKPADKVADKTADKAAPTVSAKKPADSKPSKRGAAAAPVKSAAKKAAKKPAPKAKRGR
jgi:putative FmdB family regulatory protein